MHKSVGKLALAGAASMVLSQMAQGQSTSGLIIESQAVANYVNPLNGVAYEALSNTALIRVRPVSAFTVSDEQSKLAEPGSLTCFAHKISNTGNMSETYLLTASSSDLIDPQAYIDGNHNGLLEPNETRAASVSINQGSFEDILFCGFVPSTALSAIDEASVTDNHRLDISLDVTAVSTSLTVSRTDTAVIVDQLPFLMVHTSTPSCPAEIDATGTIDYRVDLANIDQLPSQFQSVQIDGVTRTGQIIMAKVPANTELVAGAAVNFVPATGSLIVQELGSVSSQWVSYDNWTGANTAIRIGIFIPDSFRSNLPPTGANGFVEYSVQTKVSTTAGTKIHSQFEVDFDFDNIAEFVSNQVCAQVSPDDHPIDATLEFIRVSADARRDITAGVQAGPLHTSDADFDDSGMFYLNSSTNYDPVKDGVYLEVTLSELNLDAAIDDNELVGSSIVVDVSSLGTEDGLQVEMLETGPNTGVFRSTAPIELNDAGNVNRNLIISQSAFTSKAVTPATVCQPGQPPACVLDSGPGDRLSATLSNENISVSLVDQVVVNPYGTVFDAASFDPIEGAKVTIYDVNGQIAEDPDSPGTPRPVQTTDDSGRYFIPRLNPGEFYIEAQPPQDFTFPSTVPPVTFFGKWSVTNNSYGEHGYGGQGSGYFNSAAATLPSIIDIPIDPKMTLGQLSLTKEASPENVSYGDRVTYTLQISNSSNAKLYQSFVQDIPAKGLKIIEGTALYGDAPITPIQTNDGLRFELGILDEQSSKTLTYQMLVGPSTHIGKAINSAIVQGQAIGGGSVAKSTVAPATVSVRDDGIMSDRGLIVGTVWIDSNLDGKRDKNEQAVPGARIWLEDGTWVVTDALGRYSLFGVKAGTHAARLDPESLPEGLESYKHDNRLKGRSGLRLVDMTAGQMHRADFALRCGDGCVTDQNGEINPEITAELQARAESVDYYGILDEAFGFEGLLTSNGLAQKRFQHANAGPDGDSSNGVITDRGISGRALSNLEYEDTSTEEDLAPQSIVQAPDPEQVANDITREQGKAGTWLWPEGDLSRDGRFMAVIPSGIMPTLKVNGKTVSNENLGAQIENREQQAQVAAWYGVELKSGENRVQVVGVDPFGNERIMAEQSFTKPGQADQLLLIPAQERISADGFTRTEFVINLLDKRGVKVTGQRFARVLSTEGKLVGKDVRPSEDGLQVRIENGEGRFEIESPSKPGRVTVGIELDNGFRAQRDIDFVTPMRDFMAVGVLQTGSKFTGDEDFGSSMAEILPRENVKKSSRGAFFATGRIRGDALLTVAYDTEKDRNDYLLRDLDPQRYYPIYGDSSSKGFMAQSRSKAYAKIEKSGMAAMWGDFVTDRNSGESLGASRRTLTGFNAVLERGPLTMQAFSAEVKRETRSVRVRGNGTAMLYTLPGAPIEPLTDVLTIEVRDQNNPGLIVEETELQRFRDYLLDTDTGALTMRRVIPTFDDNGNPVYLRAVYDTTQEIEGDWASGVRAKLSSKRGQIWANYTDENDPDRQRQMAAAGAEILINDGKSRAWIEGGWMETDTIASAYAFRSGVEADLKYVSVRADFNQAERGFDNLDSPVAHGRQEMRVQAQLKSEGWLSLQASYFDSRDMTTADRRGGGDLIAEAKKGNWTFSLGPRFTYTDDAEGNDDQATVVARVRHSGKYLGRAGSVYVQAEHSVYSDAALQAELGGELQVANSTKLYARYTFIDELPDVTYAPGLTSEFNEARQNKTVFGVETSWLKGTTAYGEWRVDGAIDTGTAEAAYGIRADWEILPDLMVTPAIESVHTVEGTNSEDSFAVSVGILDKRDEDARRSARLETRMAEVGDYYGVNVGWAQRFAPTLSGAIRIKGQWDEPANEKASRAVSYALGMAHRPINGGTDLIAMYQFEHERGPGTYDDRDVHLISTHANHPFLSRNEVSGRFAMKWEDSAGISTSIHMLDARFLHDFNDWIDFSVQGGYRGAMSNDVSEYSYGAAIGITPIEGLRLVTGYNAEGFRDRDLDPDYSNAKGAYWRTTATFDESWFGWLTPSR